MKKKKIADLEILNEHKAILTFMSHPRRAFEIAGKFNLSLSHVYNQLGVWKYKKWIITIDFGRYKRYKLNESVLIP